MIDPRLIPARWLAAIVLLYPAIMAVSIGLARALGGERPSLAPAPETLTRPEKLVPFLVTMIVAGPVSEELGWRGFALDRLQARWSSLGSSLLLGAVAVVWHRKRSL